MTNATINKIILSATTAMFLTACGGGGDTTSNQTAAEAAAAKIEAYAEDGTKPVPTLQDYIDVGLTGIDAANLDRYNALVEDKDAAGVDSLEELNALVANIPSLPDTEEPANPNVAPVAIAPSAAIEVLEDSSNNEITLEGTDEDNDTLIYAIVDQPSYGTVTLTGNTAKYTPKANYFGEDSFTFKVNDGTVDSAEATVNIIVTDVVEIISPLKTGQTTSYDASGTAVTDESPKDNAYYNDDKGVTPDYSRDALTGLVWEDNPIGTEAQERKTWTEAIDYCENLEGGGKWRLPNINELETITDRAKGGNYMNETKARANNVRCVKDLAE